MNVKIKIEEKTQVVTPVEMKCGQIGIIRKWTIPCHIGTVIQKHGDKLIALGKEKGDSWSGISEMNKPQFQVELLKSGDTITIE